MDKDQIAKAIQEAKELIDEVMPLESSVIKDQILLTLINASIQRALAREMPSVESIVSKAMVTAQREVVAAHLTATAARKGEDWAWNSFCRFVDRLERLSTTPC